jgi:hypothetical protein
VRFSCVALDNIIKSEKPVLDFFTLRTLKVLWPILKRGEDNLGDGIPL